MKTFEIQTPLLKKAATAFGEVMEGRKAGTMERDEGRDIVAAGNGIVRTIGQELKVRLALPKLNAIEAKMAESA